MVICLLTEKRESAEHALRDIEFAQNLKQQVREHYGLENIEFMELNVDTPADGDLFTDALDKKGDREVCILLSGEGLKGWHFLSILAIFASVSRHSVSYAASDINLANMAQIVIDTVYEHTGVLGVDRTMIFAAEDKETGDVEVERIHTDRIILPGEGLKGWRFLSILAIFAYNKDDSDKS